MHFFLSLFVLRLQGHEIKGTNMKIEYAIGKANKNDKFSNRGIWGLD